MAITEYPAVGTRVRGEWTHPTDPAQWENVEGTVVTFKEALTAPAPDGAGLVEEEAEFYELIGAFDGRVAIKIETTERGTVPAEIADELSSVYAQFEFADVTVLN